jgi:hypothetical protein
MEKASNGTGDERQVYKDDAGNVFPRDLSRDGRWLALDRFLPLSQPTIDVVPGDGRGAAVRVPGGTSQLAAQFSPDGRFIAYASNETGAPEVYVQTWPLGGGKWQISNGGGSQARWRKDGKELFYRNAEFQFFAVPVSLEPRFTAGIPTPLFKRRLQIVAAPVPAWTITSDGQKFILNAALASAQASPFTVVLNWPETLNAK